MHFAHRTWCISQPGQGKENFLLVLTASLLCTFLLYKLLSVVLQVLGKVPTISINKTEGCHIYLSEESLDCEIVSAKSSEMNILIPQDGDYVSNNVFMFSVFYVL